MYVLVPSIKTQNNKLVYKYKNGYYTNASDGKKVKIKLTDIVKKYNDEFLLKHAIPNFNKTQYTYYGEKVYIKNGKIYHSGGLKLTEIPSLATLTNAQGVNLPFNAPAKFTQGKMTFTKTNFKTLNNKPVYKKNSTGTYYKPYTAGSLGQITKSTIVSKNGVQKKLSNHLKAVPAIPVAPAAPVNTITWKKHKYTITNFKMLNNTSVYKKNGFNIYMYIHPVKGFTKVLVKNKVKKNGKEGTLQSFNHNLTGYNKTNFTTSSGVPIYKKGATYYYNSPKGITIVPLSAKVKKGNNVNFLAVFHNPKHVVLVPNIPPGPQRIKEVHSEYESALKKTAEKLSALHNTTNNAIVQNYRNDPGAFAHMNRVNTMKYRATTIRGFHGQGGGWKNSLNIPQFDYFTKSVEVSYTQYIANQQLSYNYGKNVKSFENVRVSDIIDVKWLMEQDKFIRTLNSRQLFTMYGYSHNGDVWIHRYLDGVFDMNRFKDGLDMLGTAYFAFFFQAREFYGVSTGNINNDYDVVLAKVSSETDLTNISNIMKMFINELNGIIRKAPRVNRTFILFRGQKDDKYLSGAVDNVYTAERFCSGSVSGEVARSFATGHTIQRIAVLKGSRCLLMFGATRYESELEILLPRGATYMITRKRLSVPRRTNRNVARPVGVYAQTISNLVDITLIGTVDDPAPVQNKIVN